VVGVTGTDALVTFHRLVPYVVGALLGVLVTLALSEPKSEQRRGMLWAVAITTFLGMSLELLGVFK
jgi:hypothetical protein